MRLVLIWLLMWPVSTFAHEFWLSPDKAQVASGEDVAIDFRVGQGLVGDDLPYLDDRMADLWVVDQSGLNRLSPRLGDKPALTIAPHAPGPMIIGYQSRPNPLIYENFDKFTAFVAQEGLEHLAQRHRARGLPLAGFREDFTRYAKTLVQVGETTKDLPLQPLFQFDLTLVTPSSLRLTWNLRPLANYPVSILSPQGSKQLFRTDAKGMIVLPPIAGPVLVNSVYMEERAIETGVPWHSHWASFYLPDQSQSTKNDAAR